MADVDEYGISRRHLHRLLARYQAGGLDALEPRSRRPKTTPMATPEDVRQRVTELRGQGTADGFPNRLDDHSRYLLSCTVHQPVRGDDVAVSLA